MNHLPLVRMLAAGVMLTFATLAQAQYVWVSETGVREYSDRAPPPSIPIKNILKAPHGQSTEADPPGAPAAATEAAKPLPTLADRNADFNKRLKDQAEQAKKTTDDAGRRADMAETCSRAQAAKRSIDSGERISVLDKTGARRFMEDAERAREGAKADKFLAGCR